MKINSRSGDIKNKTTQSIKGKLNNRTWISELFERFIISVMYTFRFSRPFSSPLHSISSIFSSSSSGEAHCVQILSSISSNCHSYSLLFNKKKKLSIQIRQLSLKNRLCREVRVRNAWIKLVIFSNKFIILSFKFVKCYGPLYLGDDFEWKF